jgi:4-diphosphocytidyl-2-C-methyl-D-erythritol kinase
VTPISIFAPAKLNLFLAITGRRHDGFHDLVSLVTRLEYGDTLEVEPAGEFSLRCDDPAVPGDETNLILKAARAFAAATGHRDGARFVLKKRIPLGAGLGGGSSDAVAALRALNQLAGEPLDTAGLAEVAARVGSDCPLFLRDGPVVMRGRGERVEPLAPAAAQRLHGLRVLVFKPSFGVNTAWAYARLARSGTPPAEPYLNTAYLPAADAEARLGAWLGNPQAPAEAILFNGFERPVFAKFLALPTALGELRERFGLWPQMSGSGSACFALLAGEQPVAPIVAFLREAWGDSAFVVESRLA